MKPWGADDCERPDSCFTWNGAVCLVGLGRSVGGGIVVDAAQARDMEGLGTNPCLRPGWALVGMLCEERWTLR